MNGNHIADSISTLEHVVFASSLSSSRLLIWNQYFFGERYYFSPFRSEAMMSKLSFIFFDTLEPKPCHHLDAESIIFIDDMRWYAAGKIMCQPKWHAHANIRKSAQINTNNDERRKMAALLIWLCENASFQYSDNHELSQASSLSSFHDDGN